jgi:hypothetical protein
MSSRPARWIVDDCLTFIDREIRRRQKSVHETSLIDDVSDIGDEGGASRYDAMRFVHACMYVQYVCVLFCYFFFTCDCSRSSGRGYDGLIFDPPAFGRGKVQGKVKTWQIEKDLPQLLQKIPQLLSSKPLFILITCHDERWPAERCVQYVLMMDSDQPVSCLCCYYQAVRGTVQGAVAAALGREIREGHYGTDSGPKP